MTLPNFLTDKTQTYDFKPLTRVLRGLKMMNLEDTPDVGLTNFKTQVDANPQGVLSGLKKLGRTPDTEAFIKAIKPDVNEEHLQSIFGSLGSTSSLSKGGIWDVSKPQSLANPAGRTENPVSNTQPLGVIPKVTKDLSNTIQGTRVNQVINPTTLEEAERPTIKLATQKGTSFDWKPSDEEWSNMSVAEKVNYQTNPEQWLEDKPKWEKQRALLSQIEGVAQNLFGINPKTELYDVDNTSPEAIKAQLFGAGSAALNVLPVPELKPAAKLALKGLDYLIPGISEGLGKALAKADQTTLIQTLKKLGNTPLGKGLTSPELQRGSLNLGSKATEATSEDVVQRFLSTPDEQLLSIGLPEQVQKKLVDEAYLQPDYVSKMSVKEAKQELQALATKQTEMAPSTSFQTGLPRMEKPAQTAITDLEKGFNEFGVKPGQTLTVTDPYTKKTITGVLQNDGRVIAQDGSELAPNWARLKPADMTVKVETGQITQPLANEGAQVAKETLSAEQGQTIAKQLDVNYNGIQQGFGDTPAQYTFTDKKTGSTFVAKDAAEAQTKLTDMRAKFAGAGKPPVEPPKAGTGTIEPERPKYSGTPLEQARQIQTDLETDIKVGREAVKGNRDPLVSLARLSLRDADRLNARSKTLIKRLEQGATVTDEEINALKDRVASLKDWQKWSVQDSVTKVKTVASENLNEALEAGRDRIASQSDYYKNVVRETTEAGKGTLEDRTASLSDYFKNKIAGQAGEFKATAENLSDAKKRLTDYIQQRLPLKERGKLIDAVANVNSESTMRDAVAKVAKVADEAEKRELRVDIIKELRTATVKRENGITKGKYTAEIQAHIDAIRHNLNIDRDKATAQIEDNILKFTRGEMTQAKMLEQNELLSIAGVKGQSASQLEHTLEVIQNLKKTGRLERTTKYLDQKAVRDKRISDIVSELTKGKGTKSVASSIPCEMTATKDTVLGKVFNRNYSFGSLMEKLSKYTKKPRQSALAKLDQLAYTSRQAESEGIISTFSESQKKALEIFGAKNRSELTNTWRQMTHEKVKLRIKIVHPTEGPKWVDLELTKGQLMKKYQEMLDPTLDKTFEEGMNWGYDARSAVVDSLTDKEKAWAEYQMNHYQKYWDSINQVYKEKYGVDLGHNPYYSPIRRDIEAEIPEDLLVYEDLQNYASVLNGSLKARVASRKPLKFTDANEVFVNHIQQMEHFKAWANTMTDLRSTFGSKQVRDAIIQYHGKDILGQVDTLIDRFAKAGVDRQHTVHALDILRANFSRSILGLKPNIALQQVTTLPMFLSEMSVKDLTLGIADFYKNPIANYRKAIKSGYLNTRYTQGMERDIAAAKSMNLYRRAFSGQGSVKDWTYALMESGDKAGVVPGWWAKYKAGLKEGLSDVDAMREAGMAVDRTQNTSAIDTLSTLQSGGSFWKAMTMFQNQPNKYFQIIANNMRDIRYGRGNPVKAAVSVALAWAVMPAIFQFVSDGFQFKKDRQARAVLLGPINDLLVIGQIAQNLGDKIAGEPFDYQPSPATSVINDTGNLISKIRGI